jgi:hypothetical protein
LVAQRFEHPPRLLACYTQNSEGLSLAKVRTIGFFLISNIIPQL